MNKRFIRVLGNCNACKEFKQGLAFYDGSKYHNTLICFSCINAQKSDSEFVSCEAKHCLSIMKFTKEATKTLDKLRVCDFCETYVLLLPKNKYKELFSVLNLLKQES